MPLLQHDLPNSTAAQALVVVLAFLSSATVISPSVAVAQDNPYGEIDPSKASVSLLHSSVGTNGTPIQVSTFDRLDPTDSDRLFEALLAHPIPAMRTLAGISLVKRGARPAAIASRLNSEDAAGALVVGTLAANKLDPKDAIALIDGDVIMPPVAQAIMHARARRTSDLEALATISEDPANPPLARGLAATAREQDFPGSVQRWMQSIKDDSTIDQNQRDRTVFETIEAARILELGAGLDAIQVLLRDRASNDGLRAASILALMQVDPDRGLEAWKTLATAPGSDVSIPIGLLLVAAEIKAPSEYATSFPSSDPLQKDIRSLILASPADRPEVAIDAIRRGHIPTMRWLLELPDDQVPVEALEAIIERGTRSRRAVMVELMTNASETMGRIAPERLIEPLERANANGDHALTEVMLRGLIIAGSEPAAAAARSSLEGARKATRSLALLAVASGSNIDEDSLQRLGRIAAGGGDLPQDLRPMAAWQHLRLTDRLDESIPQIMAP